MLTPDTNSDATAIRSSQSGMDLAGVETASFWSNIAVVIFGILAAISAAFALLFASKAGALKDAELTRFQAEAKADISKADARAAEANAKAAEAGEGAAKALADASAASERAGKLELDAAVQRERAAKAERDLLSLQQQLAPRSIPEEKRSALIEALKRTPTKGPIDVVCVLGDEEGLAFATQVDEILKSAGWPTNGVSQGVYSPTNPIGFGLFVREGRTAPPYAGALQKAFESVGLPLPGVENGALNVGVVQLLIGNKPR